MAARHRDVVRTVRGDAENMRPGGKAMLPPVKPLVTRRPALNDLGGNKVPLQRHESLKETNTRLKGAAAKETAPLLKAYSTSQLKTVTDPDSKDPQLVAEYATDIYRYLRELEMKYPIKENFLEGHQSSPRMRAVLVNWLITVHESFKLCLETLHTCVSYVDRYLQKTPNVGRHNLQLLGTSALLVACKYEEIYIPEISEMEYICDNAYTAQDILKMEQSILKTLEFNLGKPLSIHFLRRFSKLSLAKMEHHNLSKYLLELALFDATMSPVRPSLQAAAACCLSMLFFSSATCPSRVWTTQLAAQSECKYSDFKHLIPKYAELLLNADSSKFKGVYTKYSSSKFGKISLDPKLKGPLIKKLAASAPKV